MGLVVRQLKWWQLRKRIIESNLVSTFWVIGVASASHTGNKKKPFVPVFLKLCRAGH